MSDTSYAIEVKPASKNGWFTPGESRSYYGRYDRVGYCVHWWGGGQGADSHDSIVDYMNRQAQAGQKSTNYVSSDRKITLCVGPDNVAWCQQSGNATDISVETQPTLGDEGYRRHGWLKDQLDQRFNRRLIIRGHNFWTPTQCPGTISLDRIAQEADKWARGVYDQPVTPDPKPEPPVPKPDAPKVTLLDVVTMYTLHDAKLVDVKTMQVIKKFPIDVPMEIRAKVHYNNMDFYATSYAINNSTGQAFLVGDLKDQPTPTPVPTPEPAEWVKNLRDIDDTQYWFKENQELINITTGEPTGTKKFEKDDSFTGSALTSVGGVEYRITEYSFKKNIFNGVPIDSLTLTEPGVPDIPPVPDPTPEPQPMPDPTPPNNNNGGGPVNSQPINVNVLLVRALKTFIQSSGAVLLSGLVTAVDIPTTKALIIGSIAAGISAVMNLFISPQEAK